MKALLLVGLAITTGAYIRVMITGRRARASRGSVSGHRTSAWAELLVMYAYVVTIEICARIKGDVRYDLFFWIHLAFAVPALLAISLLVLKLNGLRWPLHHAKLAYGSAFFFFGMSVTGFVMILTRF